MTVYIGTALVSLNGRSVLYAAIYCRPFKAKQYWVKRIADSDHGPVPRLGIGLAVAAARRQLVEFALPLSFIARYPGEGARETASPSALRIISALEEDAAKEARADVLNHPLILGEQHETDSSRLDHERETRGDEGHQHEPAQ